MTGLLVLLLYETAGMAPAAVNPFSFVDNVNMKEGLLLHQ